MLMATLGIHYQRLAIHQCTTSLVHTLLVLGYGSKTIVAGTIGWEHTKRPEYLVDEWMLKDIGTSYIVEASVSEV
jgi:hypothetical protein